MLCAGAPARRPVAARLSAPLDVVGAALAQHGRVLAARRRQPPGWEFPGGKIEPGETPQAAIERECREELGVTVRAVAELGVGRDAGIRLRLWQVRLVAGTPRPLADHDALRWLGRDELEPLDWLAADRTLLPGVRALLG